MNTLTPSQLLAEIKAKTRLGEKAIGDRIGCSQPTVNRILNGQADCKSSTFLELQKWYAELQESEISGEKVG